MAVLMQRTPRQLDNVLVDCYQKVMQLEGVQGVQVRAEGAAGGCSLNTGEQVEDLEDVQRVQVSRWCIWGELREYRSCSWREFIEYRLAGGAAGGSSGGTG